MTVLNQVNIESGVVDVAEFKQTDAALSHLREKYSAIPDANTTEGYDFVKAGVKELTGLRTAIEAKRKEIKAPYIAAGQIIDAEAKRIIEAIQVIEEPLKVIKKEVDDREKRIKEERLARLNFKINSIRSNVAVARGLSSAEIAELISSVDAIDATQDFYELTHEAVNARAETLKELGEMYQRQLSFEESERVRLEEEAKRKELEKEREVDQRINNLKMMPMQFMQSTRAQIEAQVKRLQNYVPGQSEFGERWIEADNARIEVISQLQYLASTKPVDAPVVDVPAEKPQLTASKPVVQEQQQEVVEEAPAQMLTMLVTYPANAHDLIIKYVEQFGGYAQSIE